jgi:hypothetical protein
LTLRGHGEREVEGSRDQRGEVSLVHTHSAHHPFPAKSNN